MSCSVELFKSTGFPIGFVCQKISKGTLCKWLCVLYWFQNLVAVKIIVEVEYTATILIGTVLYKTKSLDGTNHKNNPNPNTIPIQLFYAFLSTVL